MKFNIFILNMANEELGIVLKLLEYLDYKNINMINIQNNNDLKYLINAYNPYIQFSDSGIKVNIKNSKRKGIVINYLNNFKTIHSKRVYIIPWTNPENPLIMFKHNKKYKIKKKKVLKKHISSLSQYNNYYQQMVIQPTAVPIQRESTKSIKLLIKSLSNKISKINDLLK